MMAEKEMINWFLIEEFDYPSITVFVRFPRFS